MKPLSLALIILLATTTAAFAQKLPPYFAHYDIKNGLSSNIVTCIYKDKKGYLWVGTNNGLNRFNGTSFEVYRKESNSNSNSIGGNFIKTIYEDSQGRIWVSSDNGKLSCLQYPLRTGNEFLNFNLTEHFPSVDGVGITLHFFEDNAANLFAFTGTGMLFRYNNFQNKFEPVIKKAGNGSDSPVSGIFLGMNKKSNELYVLRKKDSVFVINTGSLRSKFIPNKALQNFLKTNVNIKTFIQRIGLQEFRIWFFAELGLLMSFDAISGKTSTVVKVPEQYRANYTYVRCIGSNRKGQICIGINTGGILLYDTTQKKFEELTIPFELANENRLAEVYNFFLDENEVFWVCTRSGIYQQSPAMNIFENYTIKQRKKSYSYIININSFYKIGSKLWIPTENNMMLYDFDSNTLVEKNVQKDGSVVSPIHFFKDGSNRLFINTYGIQLFDPATGKIKEIECRGDTASINGFRKGRFHTIFRDTIEGDEVWWLSGWGGRGLYLYNTNTKIVKRIPLKDGERIFPSTSLRGIVKDQFGRIWVGSERNGLIMIDNYHTFSHHVYKSITNDSTSLPSNVISDLCKDKDGNIWVITSGGGIARMNFSVKRQPVFKTFSRNAGLYHLALYDALRDNNNNIWMSSSAGIEKFSIKTSGFTHYGYNNGIFNSQFATGKYIDDEGYFYLSSWYTFIRFHPDEIKDNLSIPAINISHLQVMNRDSSELLLRNNTHLPYNKNSLSFSFEAIDLINAHASKYRYMMAGIDEEWVYADNRNYVSYSDMPPGKYTFRFTACNNEGIWNEHPAAFSFIILPPWYETWWFYGLCTIAVGAIIYGLFKYRLQQKIKVLQIRNGLHRDLHDDVGATLSSVKAYSEILRDNPDNPVIAELIKDNSTEMLERLEVISWATNPQHDNFKSLYEKMNKFAQPLCHAHAVDFVFEKDGISDNLVIPADVRQNTFLVFKEAINNVIKYAGGTECRCSLATYHQKFILEVADNGVGMDGTIRGNGSGIKNMKKRAEALKGFLEVENNSPKGTSIKLVIQYPFKIPNTWDGNKKGK